jgi:hypothetical protein
MKPISYVINGVSFDELSDAIGIMKNKYKSNDEYWFEFFEAIIDGPPSIMNITTYSKETLQNIITWTPPMSEEQMRNKFQGRQLEVALNYLK